jgi:hypothetical protein
MCRNVPTYPWEDLRIVNAGLFHSVDGVVESPDQWQFDSLDDELGATLTSVLIKTDTV